MGHGGNGFGPLGTGDKLMKTAPVQVDSSVMRLADLPDPWPGGVKVTAPDKISGDQFGISIHHSGNLLAVGAFQSGFRRYAGRRRCLPISPRNQWIDYLSQQSDRSRQGGIRQVWQIRFQVGKYSRHRSILRRPRGQELCRCSVPLPS